MSVPTVSTNLLNSSKVNISSSFLIACEKIMYVLLRAKKLAE
jgi:hypothetical protein